jgi:AcrR family transcriptional regulator
MPKRVNKEAKRIQIRQAAVEVFATRGMRATKMADIATQAGIGKGTVYEYYGSKEEIFTDAMLWYMTSIEDAVTKQISQVSDPRAKLRSLVWGMIDGASTLGEYIGIMLDFWGEGLRADGLGQWRDVYQSYIDVVDAILREGVEKKVFRNIDTRSLASALIGLFDGLIFQMILFGPDYPVRKTVDVLIDSFLHGVELNK